MNNHYSVKYNNIIPLWVLMPQLDFGTTAFFYKCCPKSIQSQITKQLKYEFLENYPNVNKSFIFTPELLSNILFFINSFRNICAHNERLYDYIFSKNIINTTLLHDHYNINFKYGLFDLILILKMFLSNEEYHIFSKLFLDVLTLLKEKFDKKIFIQIIQKMNFNREWERILELKID